MTETVLFGGRCPPLYVMVCFEIKGKGEAFAVNRYEGSLVIRVANASSLCGYYRQNG
ncbi:MAG: hypothetical protein ACUBOA_09575 [Candidatus Loosdrechtia sp.]|uniref:hypothetical protein n=1 Tax=Candidatus Loosdrechtia sp. TaxID=3101272 RepID=UPI00403B13C2